MSRGRFERCERAARREACPERAEWLAGDGPRNARPRDPPARRDGAGETAERLLRRIRDRADDAGKATGGRERADLHVDGRGTRSLGECRALVRIVDDPPGGAEDGRLRARNVERASLPEHATVLVDDARRAEKGARAKPAPQGAGDSESNDLAVWEREPRADADPRDLRAPPLRRPLLDCERADEEGPGRVGQLIVQARLRTVSRTLADVASVAAGSKPEWIAQCSQRWSFPGP